MKLWENGVLHRGPHYAVVGILTFCLTAGCAGAGPVEGPVRLGEIARAGGPRVRPDRVIEDSRCPSDVSCVTAGRLIVRATVFGGGWSKQVDLTLGEPIPVADGLLTLTEAVPSRIAGQSIKSTSYRFAFLFQGGL